MTVHLIAYTQLSGEIVDIPDDPDVIAGHVVAAGRLRHTIENWLPEPGEDDEYPSDGDALAEFAGRACYQSWDRPSAKTRQNSDYLANIIDIGHESVLSHAGATFYITGVSRSLTHELVRHRWMSFSQLSQRYVDHSTTGIVIPPVLLNGGNEDLMDLVHKHADVCRSLYEYIADELLKRSSLEKTAAKKEARGAARAVLPECTTTQIVVSTNYRGWRDFLNQRWSVHADQEIRELAGEILEQLVTIAPNTFQDYDKEKPRG